tara:strand:+ start:228 stop:464 length:237 start_codon:yes stop_codon:yes gene_type:complete
MAIVKDNLLMPGLREVADDKASNYFRDALFNDWWIEPCNGCGKHIPQTEALNPVTDYSSFECNITSYYCDDCFEIWKY